MADFEVYGWIIVVGALIALLTSSVRAILRAERVWSLGTFVYTASRVSMILYIIIASVIGTAAWWGVGYIIEHKIKIEVTLR